jgi:quercetin dioxygenase-like cupin family protein
VIPSPPTERLQLILDASEIAGRPRERMQPGVLQTVLWREGHSTAGLMWIEAGAIVPEHRHDGAEHHIWLLDGQADVGGRRVGQGSYWHVPAGVPHAVDCRTTNGGHLFYLYLPTGGPPTA